jgi:hypothetical protein
VQAAKRTPVDLREWACGLMDRDNRKSHLVPQLSPATQDLLRSSDSPTYGTQATPTSSEYLGLGNRRVTGTYQSYRLPSRPPAGGGPRQLSSASGSSVHPGVGSRVRSMTARLLLKLDVERGKGVSMTWTSKSTQAGYFPCIREMAALFCKHSVPEGLFDSGCGRAG